MPTDYPCGLDHNLRYMLRTNIRNKGIFILPKAEANYNDFYHIKYQIIMRTTITRFRNPCHWRSSVACDDVIGMLWA